MTIDLTGPVPCVTHSCDSCGSSGDLYRLVGTTVVLCQGCFAEKHG